jgi:hypothetical protein
MSPSPTDRFLIEAVFDARVDLSTDEQIAYLDRTASADPESHEEVLRQLEAHRHGSHGPTGSTLGRGPRRTGP